MKPFAEEIDEYRNREGWSGETKLFQLAHEQHSKTHPKKVEECNVCGVIYKHLSRLAKEGERLVEEMRTMEAQKKERAK